MAASVRFGRSIFLKSKGFTMIDACSKVVGKNTFQSFIAFRSRCFQRNITIEFYCLQEFCKAL